MLGSTPANEAGSVRDVSLGRYAIAALVVIFFLALAAVVGVERVMDEERKSLSAVTAAHDARDYLQRLYSSLQEAERSARGFVLTNDSLLIQPFQDSEAQVDTQLASLENAVAEPEARQLLEELRSAVDGQREYNRGLISSREGAGSLPAPEIFREHIGKRRIDAIRALIDRLDARLSASLEEGIAESIAAAEYSGRIVHLILVGGIVLVLLIGWRFFKDVRRRLVAEANLRVSMAVTDATMNSIPQGISVFDRNLRLLAWNPQFSMLRGIDPKEVRVGMSFDEVIGAGVHLEDVLAVPGTPEGSVGHREVLDRARHIKEMRREDGLMLEVMGQPRDDGTYILTYTDITPLKRSELAYRDQATRLSSILDAVVDAIITINESGSIESWSKGAERLFGYRAEQVIRRNVNILMPEPHASSHDSYLSRYVTTGIKRIMGFRREMEGRHRDGRSIPVDLGVSEMMIGGRRLFIGVVRDITERRAVERLKSEFVSTVSHELRTPLTSISGALGLLSGNAAGEMSPKAKRLVDIAQQNCARLIRLINDILDLEKSEAGRLDLRMVRQGLLPVVAAAIEANHGFADTRGVVLRLDPDSVDGVVQVDRDRLIQVLTNLLSNAIKFSPDEGIVTVRTERAVGMLNIFVIDQGPGIPDSFRSRIFQKFAQADSSDSRARGGTGLGLSIAQSLTERLGGAIDYQSTPGGGTTFKVSIPESAGPGEGLPVVNEPAPGSRILVCEDDPDIAAVLVELLGGAGLQPVVAANADVARRLLQEHLFDLALIDLNLPDTDGLELIANLRSDPAMQSLPMIVMTARHEQGSATLLQSLQLADWLTKPIDSTRLLNSIQSALRGADSPRYRILHVEDDDSLVEMLHASLEPEAEVAVARSLAEARGWLSRDRFDLIILDVGLQDGSGLELLPLLRGENSLAPPVVLYSATEASHEVAAQVHAALVKSRDSIEQLLFTVRQLARRHAREAAAAGKVP